MQLIYNIDDMVLVQDAKSEISPDWYRCSRHVRFIL